MDWLEISVRCDEAAVDAVSQLFERHNPDGGGAVIQIDDFDAIGRRQGSGATVRTYLPLGVGLDDRSRLIQDSLLRLRREHPISEPEARILREQDWSTAWRAHYRPLRVGQRLLVTPAWLADEAAGMTDDGVPLVPIILEPGMAFGTGQHASSQLCLAGLERHLKPGATVLDVGSGSGILSIAAARLGAARVLAMDTDPVAVAATVENCRLNGVGDQVEARVGTLPAKEELPGGWDVIVVNILAEVIADLLNQGLGNLLAPQAVLILSGIIQERIERVMTALSQNGLALIERTEEGEWVGLVARPV